MTDTLFLTSADVDDLAEPADYVAVVRDAYRQIGEGAPAEPRTKLLNREPPGMLTTYAAVLPETGAMGGYTYSAGFGGRRVVHDAVVRRRVGRAARATRRRVDEPV